MLEKTIEFFSPLKGYIPDPQPASFFIPKEYKAMKPYITDSLQYPTVKKCIPFLDALMTGYILPFSIDYEFVYDKDTNERLFTIPRNIPPEFVGYFTISEHHNHQTAPELRPSNRTIDTAFKFSNPWVIKTPPGYSCIFVTPFNHTLPFELVTGIVDTDQYEDYIKFPFYWTSDNTKNVILQKGSPMALVIPFKRESWKMKTNYSLYDQKTEDKKMVNYFSNLANNYKNKNWRKKSFK